MSSEKIIPANFFHYSMPPAAKNLFEKTPLRGESFAVQCRRTMLKTACCLLEHFKYRTVGAFWTSKNFSYTVSLDYKASTIIPHWFRFTSHLLLFFASLRVPSRLKKNLAIVDQASKMLGIEKNFNYKYEDGRRFSKSDIFAAIMDKFHISIDYLITGEGSDTLEPEAPRQARPECPGDNIIYMSKNREQFREILNDRRACEFLHYFCTFPFYRDETLQDFEAMKPYLSEKFKKIINGLE